MAVKEAMIITEIVQGSEVALFIFLLRLTGAHISHFSWEFQLQPWNIN